jgi:hypothetical protein
MSRRLAAVAVLAGILAMTGGPAPAAGTPRCLGAAARDPQHPCHNPRLRLTVTPTPDEAVLIPGAPCIPTAITAALLLCGFGTAPADALASVAIVGDSHAWHWRPALAVAAAARRWSMLDFGIPHCLFSASPPAFDPAFDALCVQRNHDLIEWLTAHPEIQTLVVSGFVIQRVMAPRGPAEFAARVDGFVTEFAQLPPSITSLVVIRDVPRELRGTHDCVRRAMAARRPAGTACAIARRAVLRPDPAVTAARRLRGRGAHVVDLTDFFCDRRVCFPVVGGVLVNRDGDHLTRRFAETLGPYLLQQWP